jgi:type IX secretion system protein PorZ/two component regulator with propeller domain
VIRQKILKITIALLFGTNYLSAQTDIPVHSWRSHLSYNNIIDISSSDQNLYVAAENSLFFIDQDEFSINKITKNDGLSDVSIGAIQYDQNLGVLIIGYANGNIDLIYEDQLTNISTVKDASLIGEKRFYDIKFHDGLVYLSNDQGIFVLNTERREIVESYLNLNKDGSILSVSEISFGSDSIYASTPEGLLSASMNATTNRQDFNNWKRSFNDIGFTGLVKTSTGLTASSENFIYDYDGSNWAINTIAISETIRDLNFSNNGLYILTDTEINLVNGDELEKIVTIELSGTSSKLLLNKNGYWIGHSESGLLNYNNSSFQNFSPSGPSSDIVWDLFDIDNNIYNISGGYSTLRQSLDRQGHISSFSQGGWSNELLKFNNKAILDIVDLEVLENNSFESNFFAASFQEGLINISSTNSIIDENTPGSTLERINGQINMTSLAKEGTSLWMSIHGVENSIHQWNLETNLWQDFNFGFTQARYPMDLLVLPNGDKWVSLDANRGGGILVFNQNSNLSRYLNTNGGQGGLPGRQVTSMVMDQNNFLWIGTNAGIAFYPNPFNVLDGNSLSASIPIYENSFLLRDEFITSVAVDPGNRKWIGTATNGIWLFSETGEELVFHFTEKNSPLLSNEIETIQVDVKSGEVFIGTSAGLVSFRSDAIEGKEQHSDVKVFPNPVTRNFNGVVTISGLVNSATVKITDASGKLVKELKSQGSAAIWDAKDHNGKRVQTGVYLVFSSNTDGSETYVAKIAVI